MMRTTVRGLTSATVVAALAAAAVSLPASAWGAGVVGTGSGLSCTDAALNTALTGGGLVTFNCGPTPVTIDISPGGGGTGTKTISTDTTIDGGGLVTISGGNAVGAFISSAAFTVQNLTIANGSANLSGGIFNLAGGTLSVNNSTFSSNSSNWGGGAIATGGGTVTIANSTFSDNSTPFAGGAIFNNSTVTVTNSTFFGNSAASFGGAIFTNGHRNLTVTNCTFSGNSAPLGTGAIVNNQAVSAILTNTIVASNPGGNCGGDGTITDGGHNLEDDSTCGFSAANGSVNNTNPLLDPAGLKNNGGPTQTIALLAGSPAIDAGDPSVCAVPPENNVDQRGQPRATPTDPICDIGAFEFQLPAGTGAPVPLISSALLMTLVALLSAVGYLSLRPHVPACPPRRLSRTSRSRRRPKEGRA